MDEVKKETPEDLNEQKEPNVAYGDHLFRKVAPIITDKEQFLKELYDPQKLTAPINTVEVGCSLFIWSRDRY